MWKDEAADRRALLRRIEADYPGRFMLGVGAGHREATAHYASPYDTLAGYVDQLRTTTFPPKALSLPPSVRGCCAWPPTGRRRDPVSRAARAHPAGARDPRTGPAARARAQGGARRRIRRRARALGRRRVANPYLGLVNYTSNLRRLGFTDDDLDDGGSDG